MPLRRLINIAIGLSVATTLAYLLYRGPVSALVIHIVWGVTGMVTTLAFLDLAAKACPKRAEATFFALLMSVFNLGTQASQNVGAHLYTAFGEGPSAYLRLVVISTVATAAVWLLVPLVHIERIEAERQRPTRALTRAAAVGSPDRAMGAREPIKQPPRPRCQRERGSSVTPAIHSRQRRVTMQ